jgi:hypothetical protein
MLGILDRLVGKNNPFSYGQNYSIYYYCSNGNVYPNFGNIGVKVNNGETV